MERQSRLVRLVRRVLNAAQANAAAAVVNNLSVVGTSSLTWQR
jgi:hypothetical protein